MTLIKKVALAFALLVIPSLAFADVQTSTDQWNGYQRINFKLDNRKAYIVEPATPQKGNPWVIRARFFGHEPQADLALLKLGFHIGYCDVSNEFGAPSAVYRWNQFHKIATEQFQLSDKVALEGMSRGGLIIYNWAIANPTKVSCIYGDNPVLDVRSWPAGTGKGKLSEPTWKRCIEAYKLSGITMNAYKPPLDHLKVLADHEIPLLHVVGANDTVVPLEENTNILEKRYQELGGSIHVIRKLEAGHHPHSLDDPRPIVRFILEHSGFDPNLAGRANYQVRSNFQNSLIKFANEKKGTVAFMGGSITEMDGYRPMVCEWLQQRFPETEFKFINAGISSTCSTTGAMRLERDVLSHGPVDLFFVEFAVNDDQDAAHSRINCIRGMEGILRHMREKNPFADIVDTHFVNPSMLATIQAGQIPKTIEAHTAVCNAYGVTTNNLAKEVADRIAEGTLTWKVFGGTHPKPPGNQVCADMIVEFLTEAWKNAPSADAKLVAHKIPGRMLDANSYSRGRFLAIDKAELQDGWKIDTPDWSTIAGGKRDRYTSIPILSSTQPGASLKLKFNGTAIGAFIVAGPDAGRVEASIDGGKFKEVELHHRYSKALHYPRTVMFADGLESGEHQLELRVSKATSSKGHAVRIMQFGVN